MSSVPEVQSSSQNALGSAFFESMVNCECADALDLSIALTFRIFEKPWPFSMRGGGMPLKLT